MAFTGWAWYCRRCRENARFTSSLDLWNHLRAEHKAVKNGKMDLGKWLNSAFLVAETA